MKKFLMVLPLTLTIFFLIGIQIQAGNKEDVKEAVMKLYSAINARDTDTFLKYMAPGGYTEFSYDGSPLFTVGEERVRGGFSTNFKANFKVEEMQVKIFKDAAVVTGYRVGTLVRPDGTGHSIPRLCLSMMWFFQEGNWKLVHVHLSKPKEEE